MAHYLKTFYQGFPLYYAGNIQNTIKLESQKHQAILYMSKKDAMRVAENLALKYCRDDFCVVQQHE
ncbi:hypothetical protein ABID23_000975 [Bartonella silvatica]|uniref:Uncharacterized protein n=1 Tax=Bartonella silvatica TaxID=357760 RepID=A0ABV2HH54_9HYPH